MVNPDLRNLVKETLAIWWQLEVPQIIIMLKLNLGGVENWNWCNVNHSLINQTLWLQGAYQLEIISAHLERVWSTVYTNFIRRNLYRLLIGVKPTSVMCQCNSNHNSKHAHLLLSTFMHITLIKALFFQSISALQPKGLVHKTSVIMCVGNTWQCLAFQYLVRFMGFMYIKSYERIQL